MTDELTIRVEGLANPKEYFVLRDDRSLELLAADAPRPVGRLPVLNPLVSSTYVKAGSIIKPVVKLESGQVPYKFPAEFVVYF